VVHRSIVSLLPLVLPLLTACPRPGGTGPEAGGASGRARVETFTESGAVQSLLVAEGTLWVGTGQGLVAWDLKAGRSRTMTIDDGLPGNDIVALASGGPDTLWVASTAGIARRRGGSWSQFGDCPLAGRLTAMASTPDGQVVWVGGAQGLARLSGERWTTLFKGAEVTVLRYAAAEKTLWVGTRQLGVMACQELRCVQYGKERVGADHVISLVLMTGGALAVLDTGRSEILAIYQEGTWHRYQVKGLPRINWANFVQGRIHLSVGSALYRLTPRKDMEAPPGPLRLTALSERALDFVSEELKRSLPRDVTVMEGHEGALFLGSRRLGVARFDGDLVQHYRTADLTAGARRISVVCDAADACLMAGGPHLYRLAAGRWQRLRYPHDADAIPLWVGRAASGKTWALVRGATGGLEVAPFEAGKWGVPVDLKPALRTRRGPLGVSVTRFGPDGKLYVGLTVTEAGETRGAGLAVLDLTAGTAAIHSRDAGLPATPGQLGVPQEVSGLAFRDGAMIIGSKNGVTVVGADGKVAQYTENEGLVSELVRDALETTDRRVLVATPAGLGEWDGKAWRFSTGTDDPRTGRLSGLAAGPGGAVWIASETGLHRLQDGRVTSFDESDGLLQRSVLGVAVDATGRVWALHRQGLSIVTPKN
jgi:hypothetical protein